MNANREGVAMFVFSCARGRECFTSHDGLYYRHYHIIITMYKLFLCTCSEKLSDLAPLVLRVALGAVFAWHGYDKIFSTGLPGVTGFLGSLGLPFPSLMAYILSYGEFIGGLLLIAGLFTHWIAKFDVIVAAVAFFTVHMSKGFSIAAGGYEYIMLIFAASVSLLITGAGKYSLDALWLKKDKDGGDMEKRG